MERNTKQRDAIKDVFCDSPRPLSVSEIHELAARKAPTIGIATVYRNIRALSDSGWLDIIEIPGEAPRYERDGEDHHHHFRCTSCARVFNLKGCLGRIESLLPSGFQLESHNLLLVGRCATCGNAA